MQYVPNYHEVANISFSMIFYVSVFRFGRKTALVLSVFLHLGGGFGSAFAPNYGTFVACRFIVGMSNMGIFMSAFVIGKARIFYYLIYKPSYCNFPKSRKKN